MAGTSKRVIRRPEPLIPGRQFDPMIGQQRVTDRRSYEIMRDNSVGALANLSDVALASPATNDVLTYNGTEWINAPDVDPTGGNVTTTDLQANRPAGAQGDLFFPSDGYSTQRKGASAWAPWGPLFPLVAPVPGDFSWENQDAGTTVATTRGGITLAQASYAVGGHGASIYAKAAPATPYTVQAYLLHPLVTSMPDHAVGLGLIDSVNTRMVSIMVSQGSLFITKWSSAGYVSRVNYQSFARVDDIHWMGIGDDGTNVNFYLSGDGQNWVRCYRTLRHDFLVSGPNKVGFFEWAFDNTSGGLFDQLVVTLVHWKEV